MWVFELISATSSANVPHVVESLQRLGAHAITPAHVYAMVRDGTAGVRAAGRLPTGLSVHRLTEAERTARPSFRVTRTVSVVDDSDGNIYMTQRGLE